MASGGYHFLFYTEVPVKPAMDQPIREGLPERSESKGLKKQAHQLYRIEKEGARPKGTVTAKVLICSLAHVPGIAWRPVNPEGRM